MICCSGVRGRSVDGAVDVAEPVCGWAVAAEDEADDRDEATESVSDGWRAVMAFDEAG